MKKIKKLLLKIKSFIETLTIIPLHIEYGYINGFVFQVFGIDNLLMYEERSLFEINFGGTFLYIEILFFNFKIYDKTD